MTQRPPRKDRREPGAPLSVDDFMRGRRCSKWDCNIRSTHKHDEHGTVLRPAWTGGEEVEWIRQEEGDR